MDNRSDGGLLGVLLDGLAQSEHASITDESGRQLDAGDWRAQARAAATALTPAVGPGDVVLCVSETSSPFSFETTMPAAMALGGLVLLASERSPRATFDDLVARFEPKVVVCEADQWTDVAPRHVRPSTLKERRGRLPSLRQWASGACIVATSGSTDRPRHFLRSHPSLMRYVARAGSSRPEALLTQFPLSGVGGLYGFLMAFCGCRVARVDPLDPKRFWSRLGQHRPTSVALLPIGVRRLLASNSISAEYAFVERVIVSGSPISERELAYLHEIFPRASITLLYTSTEAGDAGTMLSLPPGARVPRFRGSTEFVCAGFATPGTKVRVTGETGVEVSPGDVGEVWLGSTAPADRAVIDATCEPIAANKWIRMGDRGLLDTHGCLYLCGRTSEFISVGGRELAIAPIREVILSCPSVDDCIVVGVDDDLLGGVPAAIYVGSGRIPADQIRKRLMETIGHLGTPRWLYQVERLPVTMSSKPDLRRARDMINELRAASPGI